VLQRRIIFTRLRLRVNVLMKLRFLFRIRLLYPIIYRVTYFKTNKAVQYCQGWDYLFFRFFMVESVIAFNQLLYFFDYYFVVHVPRIIVALNCCKWEWER
jgi:hypothetical protein